MRPDAPTPPLPRPFRGADPEPAVPACVRDVGNPTATAAAGANPLAACADVARRSRLVAVRGRHGVSDARGGAPPDGELAALAARLPEFVFGTDHPCVMARSVLQRGALRVGVHADFGGVAAAVACHDLYECLAATRAEAGAFVSYAALFPDRSCRDEREFERALWRQLQAMHDVDRRWFAWDPTVASDPADPAFSFSIGGRAWFVIGLHPCASRLARRFPVPALVFNPHAQFERLRASGRYRPLRDRIRDRDRARQGSINPMLVDHGEASEARQYAGRAVGDDWRCPFVPRGDGGIGDRGGPLH